MSYAEFRLTEQQKKRFKAITRHIRNLDQLAERFEMWKRTCFKHKSPREIREYTDSKFFTDSMR